MVRSSMRPAVVVMRHVTAQGVPWTPPEIQAVIVFGLGCAVIDGQRDREGLLTGEVDERRCVGEAADGDDDSRRSITEPDRIGGRSRGGDGARCSVGNAGGVADLSGARFDVRQPS